MIDLLRDNPLLLIFFVTAIGYLFGRIPLFGIRLNVAAVLFVGLFVGALDPDISVPAFLPQLGLVIFLYALGLANGANFFRAIKQGRGQIGFILFFLALPALVIGASFFLFNIEAPTVAGLYAGAATNTAALAGVLDIVDSTRTGGAATQAVAATVVGYAFAYPVGVIGRIAVITLLERLWQVDYAAEANANRDTYPVAQEIVNVAIEVTRSDVLDTPLRELQQRHEFGVIFGRMLRNRQLSLVSGETRFQHGDIVVIAGEAAETATVMQALGIDAGQAFVNDYSVYAKRRMFVSNSDIVGQTIAALDLKEQYGALITRVRRGDADVLATRDTVLELGDRVRILARRKDMPTLTKLFGDSYTAVSQVNLLSVGFGVTIGLLLGMISITLPGDLSFQLGFAGGTLIIALILGAWRRTGSLVWTLPYSVNQTLQQVGLVLLLASIGVRSGNALESTIALSTVLSLLAIALIAVCASTLIAIIVGHRLLHIPFAVVAGMVASQPAVFSYITDRAANQLPSIGFALATPIGTIAKVAIAQLLILVLGRL